MVFHVDYHYHSGIHDQNRTVMLDLFLSVPPDIGFGWWDWMLAGVTAAELTGSFDLDNLYYKWQRVLSTLQDPESAWRESRHACKLRKAWQSKIKGFLWVFRALSVPGTPQITPFWLCLKAALERERGKQRGGPFMLARRHRVLWTAQKTCYHHSLVDYDTCMTSFAEIVDYGPFVDMFHPGYHMWAFPIGLRLDIVLRLHSLTAFLLTDMQIIWGVWHSLLSCANNFSLLSAIPWLLEMTKGAWWRRCELQPQGLKLGNVVPEGSFSNVHRSIRKHDLRHNCLPSADEEPTVAKHVFRTAGC